MFNLTDDQERRAVRLQRESIVIDSLGGYEEFPQETHQRIDQMIARKMDLISLMDELLVLDTFVYPQELGSAWKEARRASGVNVISITMGPFGKEMFSYEDALRDLASFIYKCDVFEDLVKVCSSKDIYRSFQEDRLGLVFNFQNTTHIGTDLNRLDFFYELGIRQVQMTYNDLNLVGAGCTERTDSGLSRFGQKVVERMNKLGILIDISHTGYRTTMDTIEMSEAPVAFTHTLCRAVHDHDRGKTDEQLAALAKKGGYVGILLVPGFITSDPEPTLNHFLDHLDHAVKIVGADKVGIGTDYGEGYVPLAQKMDEEALEKLGFQQKHAAGFTRKIGGYRTWVDFINITRGLVARGYTDGEIMGILGGNYLRIFKEVVG